ncbi:DUF1871 family protein [Exiguobacterium antarcticum]|uniref:DUF1871 family protein n=1 Tax=Exiguobacterium antarcticum TaxID=132920 RepID=A0ABT6QXP0_9BACL|nr:DUF1871 family protein [Exiguobacterium antarcticum]AFS71241.1 Hypothetical protein Eab7_2141 [Exiguobacterium antarcticum B7]MDI3233454.1 DUF1871 family protein [Exiguobacterium antarcticum]
MRSEELLKKYDPFHLGQGNYPTEMSAILSLLTVHDQISPFAEAIGSVFEESFGEQPDRQELTLLATNLLLCEDSCEL